MAKLPMLRPFNERDLNDDLRLHPVRANARQSSPLGERSLVDFGAIELRTQLVQHLCIEARSHLSGENKVVAFVVSDQQRAKSSARAEWVGEAADDELLRGFALHLEPRL